MSYIFQNKKKGFCLHITFSIVTFKSYTLFYVKFLLILDKLYLSAFKMEVR